jgi:hypothetical protein
VKRSSLVVKIGRLIQKLPLSWVRILERPFLRDKQDEPQLIFLIALPRSGSTLTYQAVIDGLRPLYLSNLWNTLFMAPQAAGFISKIICSSHRSNFNSDFGFIEGLCGPSEGLRFWSYWTGVGLTDSSPDLVSGGLSASRVSYLGRVLGGLTTPQRPMVAGFLGHALVTERLRKSFPKAIFIRVHRDMLSNAFSIYESRVKFKGDWFSVFPKECVEVKGRGIHAEVASQVYWLNRRLSWLERDKGTIHIRYEDLCRNPSQVMEEVAKFCNLKGLDVDYTQTLPTAFPYRLINADENADAALLCRELELIKEKYNTSKASASLR